MINATFITADQNWQDETTIYWFELEGEDYGTGIIFGGETFGVVESAGTTTMVDCDGHPIDYNDALRSAVERNCIVTDEIRAEARGNF